MTSTVVKVVENVTSGSLELALKTIQARKNIINFFLSLLASKLPSLAIYWALPRV